MSFATHTPVQSSPYQVAKWTLTTTKGSHKEEDGMTFVYQMSNWTDARLLAELASASNHHTFQPIGIEDAYWIARKWNGEPDTFEYNNCTFTKG